MVIRLFTVVFLDAHWLAAAAVAVASRQINFSKGFFTLQFNTLRSVYSQLQLYFSNFIQFHLTFGLVDWAIIIITKLQEIK